MAPRPTVIGSRVIGVDLPAFLLSKNFYSESIGMSHTAALQLPQMIALGLVWWDLSGHIRLLRVCKYKP
jgi:hypothetical protein